MGRVHVERDGVSVPHAARFVLVGTMNPEEGELRPQLLDRFGLTVEVRASPRRRRARRGGPAAAGLRGRPGRRSPRVTPRPTRRLARRIADARARLAAVVLPDDELRAIAAVCAAFDVDGMRADLVIARTAVAHAAWRGPDAVADEDMRVAARLALPHRRRRDPFDEPGLDEQQLDEALDGADEPSRTTRSGRPRTRRRTAARARAGRTAARRRGRGVGSEDDPAAARPASADDAQPPATARRAPRRRRRRRSAPGGSRCPASGEGAPGRRSRARTDTGRTVRGATHGRRGAPRAAPARHRRGRRAAPAGSAGRVGAGSSSRADDLRRADAGGPRGQPGAVRRRRSGSMAAREPDGGGQRRGAVAAARRLSAPRQGRRWSRSAAPAPRWCCRRRPVGRTPRGAGWPRCAPAAERRWPRACCGRATWCCASGCATRAARPGGGAHRRPGHRRARPGWAGRGRPPAAGRRGCRRGRRRLRDAARCGSAWPRELAGQLGRAARSPLDRVARRPRSPAWCTRPCRR